MLVKQDDTFNVKSNELKRFVIDLLIAAKCSRKDVETVSESLVWADLSGRHAQGVFRLPILVQMLEKRLIISPSQMIWTERAPAIYHLDGGNGFGQSVGRVAMERAIDLAKAQGFGLVAVRQSNHYGAASYYCSLAAEADCFGITCTNATPKVAPFGGTKAVLGTNPIAFGCPTSSGMPILVDLSTAAFAGSSVRNLSASGGLLPPGVALDAGGLPTTDPSAVANGCILPAAGPKGFGLGIVVEILSAILTGAGMSYEVGPYYKTWKRDVSCGHMFIALDICRFERIEIFLKRLEKLIFAIKASPPRNENEEIRFPGEIRARNAEIYGRDGIPLPDETVRALQVLAGRLGVRWPW